MAIGSTHWVIPDMYWPAYTQEGGRCVSHEAVCVLNAGDTECEVEITAYFEDREPVSFPKTVCPPRRTCHIRMDGLNRALGLPGGVPYASVVSLSVPAVVQYTRVDATQAANALMTTMAYPCAQDGETL